ncbi:uncharacterized protein LOC105434902 isoform X2 [Cucumis sativus]|uniref:uncharacterized protein LOC105434902 isoform X2 n=1 Tax=Cucumis sativus TaxID=3659 RepID=UPI0005EC6FAB|nr:uncharacterized protein LOC105434902 isoform X2 [Cucumis sativus]
MLPTAIKMPVRRKSSLKKPVKDVSNLKYPPTSSKSLTTTPTTTQDFNRSKPEDLDDSLDRLLLLQSDLSALTHQIDELVVKALELKEIDKQGRKEIESFTHALSDILSSLKPWLPRFQKVFSHPSKDSDDGIGQSLANGGNTLVNDMENNVADSPDHGEAQDLVSPSPLVSWRAGCNIERGRQMFLLTPLPISKSFSSKHVAKSVLNGMKSGILKSTQPCFIACGDLNENPLECNVIEPSVVKPSGPDLSTLGENLLECNGTEASVVGSNLVEGNGLEPSGAEPSGSDLTQAGIIHQRGFASPPLLSKKNCSMLIMTPCFKMSPPKSCVLLEPISESSHKDKKRFYKATPFPVGVHDCSSGSDASDGLALKYPELLGIQQAHKTGIRKKVEASPDWYMSPPKTCVLLEPSDSHSVKSATSSGCHEANKSFSHQVGVSLPHIDNTPMLKGCESVFRVGKFAGEETLKKELWMKFEAASANPFPCDKALQKTSKKGFLDLLDEVSCD